MNTNNIRLRKNEFLDSLDVKQMIVKYVYDKVDEGMKPINITKMDDIDVIRKNDYIACPKYFGERAWMIFVKMNGCYYAVTFLKQHRRNIIKNIQLLPIDIAVCEEMYNGTIMEGIYNVTGNIVSFIIDEVYFLAGKVQLLKSKDDRLAHLSEYARTKFGGNPNYRVCFCHFFQLNKKSLENFYGKIKSDVTIQEIIFYPKVHGGKIYSYMITGEDLIDPVIKMAVFDMKKTNKPDAYDLIDITSKKKIDIAIIPDMATSKMCKMWFSSNKTDNLLVRCQFLFDKKKWLPIEIISDINQNSE